MFLKINLFYWCGAGKTVSWRILEHYYRATLIYGPSNPYVQKRKEKENSLINSDYVILISSLTSTTQRHVAIPSPLLIRHNQRCAIRQTVQKEIRFDHFHNTLIRAPKGETLNFTIRSSPTKKIEKERTEWTWIWIFNQITENWDNIYYRNSAMDSKLTKTQVPKYPWNQTQRSKTAK